MTRSPIELLWTAKNQTNNTPSTADGLTMYLLRTPCLHFLSLSLSSNVNCLRGTNFPMISSLSKVKVGNTSHQAASFSPCSDTSTQKNFDLDCSFKHVLVAEPGCLRRENILMNIAMFGVVAEPKMRQYFTFWPAPLH